MKTYHLSDNDAATIVKVLKACRRVIDFSNPRIEDRIEHITRNLEYQMKRRDDDEYPLDKLNTRSID